MRRTGCPVTAFEAKASEAHAQATQLHHHVLAPGEFCHASLPLAEHFLGSPRVVRDADHPAAMVQDHWRLRECTGQPYELPQLCEENPALESQAQGRQMRKSGSKLARVHHVLRDGVRRIHEARIRVPGEGLPHAPEPAALLDGSAGYGDVAFQHRPNRVTQR